MLTDASGEQDDRAQNVSDPFSPAGETFQITAPKKFPPLFPDTFFTEGAEFWLKVMNEFMARDPADIPLAG